MRRVSSRPSLFSDGDQAFTNATIEEVIVSSDDSSDTDDNDMHVHRTERTPSHRKSHGPSAITVDHPCSLIDKSLSSAGRNVETGHLQELLSRVSIDSPASQKLTDAPACHPNKVSSKRKRLAGLGRHYHPHYPMLRSIASNRLRPSAQVAPERFTNNGSFPVDENRKLMSLTDLPEENVICVSIFLNLQGVRRLSATNKEMRKILADGVGTISTIWMETMKRSFPVTLSRLENNGCDGMKKKSTSKLDIELAKIRGESTEAGLPCENRTAQTEPESIIFIDRYHIQVAGVTCPEQDVNLPLLTGLISRSYPQSLSHCRLSDSRNLALYSAQVNLYDNTLCPSPISQEDESTRIVPVVKFVGKVGSGDRSVRSDQPFPTTCSTKSRGKCKRQYETLTGGLPSLRRCIQVRQTSSSRRRRQGSEIASDKPMSSFLSSLSSHKNDTADEDPLMTSESSRRSRCSSTSSLLSDSSFEAGHVSRACKKCLSKLSTHSSSKGTTFRPFVAPTVLSDYGESLIVDVTPRLVAYFEVTIFPYQGDTIGTTPREDEGGVDNQEGQHVRRVRHECVAVGLSTAQFRDQSNMPGWDGNSYGYHGDDGRIFHGLGENKKSYGPKFGPGDNVGCGLDYASRRIFFCKNGEFLGHAFDRVDERMIKAGLYPTVGLDSECPIFVNYGFRPFKFKGLIGM
mmetsp:Transcript_7172/g.16650  ORF Transcript_7172/g.16650 Transcript_7172/m.16650 type:complete len:685 (+) Transcript_7172:224-2278(+)